MKLYKPESKKRIIVSQYVGNAIDDIGHATELKITPAYCPCITLPSGETVVIEWEDLIEIAEKYAKEETEKNHEQDQTV